MVFRFSKTQQQKNVHVSKCLSLNRADFCVVVDRTVFEMARKKTATTGSTKNRNNNRTNTVPFYCEQKTATTTTTTTEISIEILSTKHHLLFICIHSHWVALDVGCYCCSGCTLTHAHTTSHTNYYTYCRSFFNSHQLTLIFCYVNFIIPIVERRKAQPPHAHTHTHTHTHTHHQKRDP